MKVYSGSWLQFLCKIVRPHLGMFIFLVIVSFGWAVDTTVWPYLLRRVIDVLLAYDQNRDGVWGDLKVVVIMICILWGSLEFAFRSQGFLLARFLPKIEASIRMHMFDHVQRHSPRYFNQHFSGSLANKISDMVTHASLIIANMCWMLIPFIGACVLSLCIFASMNMLFTYMLLAVLVLYFFILALFMKKCIRAEDLHGETRSSLIGKILDSISNNFAVNLFYRFNYERQYIEKLQKDEQLKNFQAKQIVEWMRLCLAFALTACALGINWYMLYLWKTSQLSTAEVVQIFNMTWNVIMVLWMTGSYLPSFVQSMGIMRQAFSIMKHPKDILDRPGAHQLKIGKGDIVFENVFFRFGEKYLFKDMNIHIKAGEKVGLVGYSGAGKSTFVNLILRFYPVESGKILIDHQDVGDITLESLRQHVVLIPQDPVLFHRSLEANIQYGNLEATQEEITYAAKLAHCDEFIRKCEDGYRTLVGERGTKLSGGERQRIAIARAMLSKAPILLLDEATSALDSVTERYIQESLELVMQNRTTIVIAHRLSTLAKMDRILVFKEGSIIEDGSHEFLLKKGGHYAKMWEMQAGGFLPAEKK